MSAKQRDDRSEELIQFEGLVTEILPDARYRVQLDAGHEIVAYTAGKMKKNRIRSMVGIIASALEDASSEKRFLPYPEILRASECWAG